MKRAHYAGEGVKGTLYIRDVDYPTTLAALLGLMERLEGETEVLSSIDPWIGQFQVVPRLC